MFLIPLLAPPRDRLRKIFILMSFANGIVTKTMSICAQQYIFMVTMTLFIIKFETSLRHIRDTSMVKFKILL